MTADAADARGCATPRPVRDETGDGPPLPSSLGSYMRRHPRFPVDWHARYRYADGRETDVRVSEVSEVGASIQTIPPLAPGDRGWLAFPQIAGRPEIEVTVVNAGRPIGRAGLCFGDPAEVGRRLATLAEHPHQPTPPPADDTDPSEPQLPFTD